MEQLLYKLVLSCILGVSLAGFVFIWFRTTFLVEYAKLLGLQRFVKGEEWESYEIDNAEHDPMYPVFLREKYQSWFTKLIGCPFCLITFLSIPTTIPISWWASGPTAFVGIFGFLVCAALYRVSYK